MPLPLPSPSLRGAGTLAAGLLALAAPATAGTPAGPALGALPGSWQGEVPAASGRTRWHLDLAPNRTFQLRQTFLDRPAPNQFDAIGRWRLEPGRNRLVLRGGREAPLFLQPSEAGAILIPLDGSGEPIASPLNTRLSKLASVQPIDPQLPLLGMVTYLADAARIHLCATGQRLPVAMENDFPALQRRYLEALPAGAAGQPLLVKLEGLITERPSQEPGQPPRRTLVVERFGKVLPGEGCPSPTGAPSQVSQARSVPLRGTRWQLLRLGDQTLPPASSADGPAADGSAPAGKPSRRPVALQLATDQLRFSGSGGCNRLLGGFEIEGESLRFGTVAGTMMACPAEAMELERRFIQELENVRRWSIDKRSLLLQDGKGRTLLLFQVQD